MVVAEIRKEQYDPRCITKLVRNFWSHPALLEVERYHGELVLYAVLDFTNLQDSNTTSNTGGEAVSTAGM